MKFFILIGIIFLNLALIQSTDVGQLYSIPESPDEAEFFEDPIDQYFDNLQDIFVEVIEDQLSGSTYFEKLENAIRASEGIGVLYILNNYFHDISLEELNLAFELAKIQKPSSEKIMMLQLLKKVIKDKEIELNELEQEIKKIKQNPKKAAEKGVEQIIMKADQLIEHAKKFSNQFAAVMLKNKDYGKEFISKLLEDCEIILNECKTFRNVLNSANFQNMLYLMCTPVFYKGIQMPSEEFEVRQNQLEAEYISPLNKLILKYQSFIKFIKDSN